MTPRLLASLPLKAVLAAVFSGLLLTAAFPKFNQTYLLWLALVPLFWALPGVSGRNAFLLGFINGLSHNLTLLYWIVYVTHVYGHLPLILGFAILLLLATYLSLYRGIWTWGISWGQQRGLNQLWWAPALWVALEFGQAYIFTGFPWELLGYGLYNCRLLVQLADLTGVYGLSFLIVFVNQAIFSLFLTFGEAGRRQRRRALVLMVIIVGATLVYGYVRLQQLQRQTAQSPQLPVAVVQGNIEQGQKWDPRFQQTTLDIYADLTKKISPARPHLVIWPETAAPFFFLREPLMSRQVEGIAREAQSYLLFGSPAFEFQESGEQQFYNRAYLLSPQGKVVGSYDKAHLVPYGEYVPLRRYFFFIGKMVPMVGDFAAGPPGVVLSTPAVDIGTLICFESIFPELSRAMAQNGANLLVNITNDAWFGTTSAPYQHLSMAVLRAVENRLSLARAANTGISAFINPEGQIIWRSDLFVPTAEVMTIPLGPGGSFYSRFGNLFAFLCLGLVGLGLLAGGRHRVEQDFYPKGRNVRR
ncbi:MAG: apolipoprotein N-acyltransferase [Desulfobacca sp. 4484_104]|nr:MAG: apolipoprotein N-acyltransferase [Desulfobacca sp. 4484_104]RLA86788.1 MAG: apolipoprotein N-acyltransferase [Deltaproteobacteria bacterium]